MGKKILWECDGCGREVTTPGAAQRMKINRILGSNHARVG